MASKTFNEFPASEEKRKSFTEKGLRIQGLHRSIELMKNALKEEIWKETLDIAVGIREELCKQLLREVRDYFLHRDMLEVIARAMTFGQLGHMFGSTSTFKMNQAGAKNLGFESVENFVEDTNKRWSQGFDSPMARLTIFNPDEATGNFEIFLNLLPTSAD